MFYAVIGAFLFGVGLRTLCEVNFPTLVWMTLLSFVVAVLARKNSSTVFTRQLTIVSLCLVAVVLGVTRTEIHYWNFGNSSLEESVGKEGTFAGVVAAEPEYKETTLQFVLDTGADKLLINTDRLAGVSYGDEVSASGKLQKPEAFETDFGRTFHYDNYLLAKRIEYRISFADVEVVSKDNANIFIGFLLNAKQQLMTGIERVLPEPQAGLGEGLLLGVKQALGSSLEQDFRTTGIIHIVVLSGYNIMLVVAFVMYALSFFITSRLKNVVGIGAIICFALVVGLSATVVRASIMASLVLFADAYSKNYHVLRALMFAGLVMVFLNPFILLYDIGFQLSFMATLGLILVAPRFEGLLASVPTRIGIREFLVATVATQLAVLPLLLYHIGEISLIAVIVNVLVLPIVPVAMFFTFLSGVLGLFSITVGTAFGFLAFLSLSYIIFVAETFATVPFASIALPPLSAWWIVVLYVVPVTTWLWLHRKTEKNELDNWEVVEEHTLLESAGPAGPAPETKQPVFFR